MYKFNIQVMDYKWQSKILKITGGMNFDIKSLISFMNEFPLDSLKTLYLHVEEKILSDLINFIICQKFKFRAYVDGTYQYYKWLLEDIEDKVHPYATSTAGASCLILSPDEKSVLMVFENNNWKFVTGSNNYKELSIETAKREMFEEIGLENDPNFIPKVIGFWNINGRFAGNINDMMTCYVLKSTSFFPKIDTFEIEKTKWIKISELSDIMENKEKISDGQLNTLLITKNSENYGYPYLQWLKNWIDEKFFEIHIMDNINLIY